MSKARPFNLFVYGTLMNPTIFRAVLGRSLVAHARDADGENSFVACPAALPGFRKVSPDNTYLYAVPDRQGEIHGYVIGPLPGGCMKQLLKYEGRNYSRKKVTVQTDLGPRMAVAFVANLRNLEHSFGYAFRDPFKQEILLRRKIESALLATEEEKFHTADATTQRAAGELMGATVRDLVRRHFEAGGISDYAIRRSLSEAPLPDFGRIAQSPQAAAVAPHYLAMVVRQVIFNEVEEKIQNDFRYELDQLRLGTHYYERTVSSVAALRLLNINRTAVASQVGETLEALQFPADPLVEYVRRAVRIADALYNAPAARGELEYIFAGANRGRIPLGAELEFSNIGHAVIADPQAQAARDIQYDGFLYFNDFSLDVLTWKLGGHVDDHHEKASRRPRRGFFEIALGSLSIEANLSKPITDDPWLLNQFIHAACLFYDIAPHSMHLSLQLPVQHRPSRDRLLGLGDLKCLFALGGDPQLDAGGQPTLRRLSSDEIVRWESPGLAGSPHMLFSEISKRRSSDAELPARRDDRQATTGLYVQQYKFLRLSQELDYEKIALAIKGVQLSCSPGSFLTPAQYQSSPEHRARFHDLLAWGQCATPLTDREIGDFLDHVRYGLRREKRGKPAHPRAYINACADSLEDTLEKFNEWARQQE